MEITLALIGVIVSFVLGWFTSHYYYKKSYEKSLTTSHITMPRKIPVIRNLPAIVRIGSNIAEIYPGNRFKIGNSPFEIEVSKEGKILLHAEVRDTSGNVVALLRESELFVSPGLSYDINSDNQAIEVVDEEFKPVLQVIKLREDEIPQVVNQIETLIAAISRPTNLDIQGKLKASINLIKKNKEVLQVTYVSFLPQDSEKGPLAYIANDQGLYDGVEIARSRNLRSIIRRVFEYPGYIHPGLRKGKE